MPKEKVYKIERIINNNVITSYNSNSEEIVLMGKGIAFRRSIGDKILKQQVEKVFVLKAKEKNRFLDIIKDIPALYFDIAMDIALLAEKELHLKLNDAITVMLADHIYQAVLRYKDNVCLKNEMLTELKRFYPKEFKIGIKSIKIIKEKTGILLPNDEAGFITFHILNATTNKYEENQERIKLINKIIEIVESYFKIDLDVDSIYYDRFITHLKYFTSNILNDKPIVSKDDFVYRILKVQYPDILKCVNLIQEYILFNYKLDINNEEKDYLIIHINNLLIKSKIVT